MSPDLVIRDLTTIPEFREVMGLEHDIWGYGEPEDAVGVPVFVITTKRGGILLGAYDGDRMVGFVYSLAGLRRGTPVQWSHMLGVLPAYRGTGLGRRLKLEQRQRSLAMGVELMEWTYDPLQALNAHLNFTRLGAVAEEYHVNVYGDSSSTLHRGNPTDRLIAQWWMRSAEVDRLARGGAPMPPDATSLPHVVSAVQRGEWAEPARVELGRGDAQVAIAVPGGFTEMLEADPGLVQAWRLATREAFTHYLGRAYRVVGFAFDAASGGGAYTLSASLPATSGV